MTDAKKAIEKYVQDDRIDALASVIDMRMSRDDLVDLIFDDLVNEFEVRHEAAQAKMKEHGEVDYSPLYDMLPVKERVNVGIETYNNKTTVVLKFELSKTKFPASITQHWEKSKRLRKDVSDAQSELNKFTSSRKRIKNEFVRKLLAGTRPGAKILDLFDDLKEKLKTKVLAEVN